MKKFTLFLAASFFGLAFSNLAQAETATLSVAGIADPDICNELNVTPAMLSDVTITVDLTPIVNLTTGTPKIISSSGMNFQQIPRFDMMGIHNIFGYISLPTEATFNNNKIYHLNYLSIQSMKKNQNYTGDISIGTVKDRFCIVHLIQK